MNFFQFLTLVLSAFALSKIARALAPKSWLKRKPFSCDLCMSVWSSLIVGVLAWKLQGHFHSFGEALAALAVVGGVSLLYTWLTPPDLPT